MAAASKRAKASTSNPEPPSPSTPAAQPEARQAVQAPTLGVLNPTPSPTPSTPITSPPDGSDYEPAAPADPVSDTPPATGTPSSGDGVRVTLDAKQLEEVARGALMSITEALHEAVARTDEARDARLWLADDDDLDAIAGPVGKIGARHAAPVAPTPDAADMIKAALGVLVYAVKNGRKWFALKRQGKQAAPAMPSGEAAGAGS